MVVLYLIFKRSVGRSLFCQKNRVGVILLPRVLLLFVFKSLEVPFVKLSFFFNVLAIN